jgi:hypothetical protein
MPTVHHQEYLNTVYTAIGVCHSTVRSESRCPLSLRYVDLVVSVEVAIEVWWCCVTFHCIHVTSRSAESVCE